MKRRAFIQQASLAGLGAGVTAPVAAVNRSAQAYRKSLEERSDVLIIGGGTGGCAAALAAARNGLKVILTEDTDWIGGQLTAQAVPPDEHPWIEAFGATRSYQEFRGRVREYYRRNYPLTTDARFRRDLNPGNGR